jgi:prophage tail gpP-like protein
MSQQIQVKLRVNGLIYEGWTQVSITRSLTNVSGQIKLGMTRMMNQKQGLSIAIGQPMSVDIGSERVATGYIFSLNPSYDYQKSTFEVICFDKTADLAHCSVVGQSTQWHNMSLFDLAKSLCKPFGIAVQSEFQVGLQVIKSIDLDEGSSVFELLDKEARNQGVLLTSNAQGNLILTRASTQKIKNQLRLGENILAASGTQSGENRFSHFIIKGQTAESWDADVSGGQSVTVRDKNISRYRPKVEIIENNYTEGTAKTRGQWQLAYSISQSISTQITVATWHDEDGKLWAVNRLIFIDDPLQNLKQNMLISQVELTEDDSGRLCILSLVHPKSFEIDPTLEKETSAQRGWSDA